jgi:hypothetical protein
MRVDRVDPDALPGLRAKAEADRGLPLPRADLDDHALAVALLREVVERFRLLV